MKYIRNISDEQNKVGDTDNVFRLNLFEDDKLFDFGENNLTVNVANSSGYILSLTPQKETGNTVIDLDFNDTPLKSLTPDDYLLEVEVKFSDGTTATFPTKGGMPFTVNGNLKETSGKLVPTVTFDNVLDAVDKKIAVYMDTVKVGPAGPVGPAGNVDTSHDNTFTGKNTFTQPIDARVKERGMLSGTVDALSMMKKAADNSGVWKLNGVTIVGSGQNYTDSIWGTLQVYPWGGDGTGATLILNAVSGISNHPAQLIAGGDSSSTSLTWYKLADDASVVHNTGSETIAGDKTFTGNNNFSGDTKLQTGNYGLRVTTTGIQKTSDGGTTWVNI